MLALTLVNSGKLGPKLIPHSEGPPCLDSFEMDKPPSTTQPPPMPNPKAGDIWPTQCGTSGQVLRTSNGLWIGSRNTTMALLAGDINAYGSTAGEIDKPVVDQTGLQGAFDFTLELPAGMLSLFPKTAILMTLPKARLSQCGARATGAKVGAVQGRDPHADHRSRRKTHGQLADC